MIPLQSGAKKPRLLSTWNWMVIYTRHWTSGGWGEGESIFSRTKPAWIDKMELFLQNAVKQNGNIYVYFT